MAVLLPLSFAKTKVRLFRHEQSPALRTIVVILGWLDGAAQVTVSPDTNN